MRKAAWVAFAIAVAGCGGASGKLDGKLSISGMMAPAVNDLTVTAIGPVGGGALTDSSGNYEIDGLADGAYAISAVVPGTVEGEVRVVASVKGGKGTAPELKFTLPPPPPAPKVGTVSGKVVYSDGSDASGITVTLTGPSSTGAAAAMDGSFSFSDLTPGLYTLAFDAADSLEKRLTIAVAVTDGMNTDTGTLTMTAVGTLTGKATKGSGSTGNSGIVVTVAGTPYRSTAADDGSYAISGVPAGPQTLVASLPDWDPATALVTVTRGSVAAPDLSLTKLSTHGTVSGVVIFSDQQDRSIITVRAQGTSLTTSCDAAGHFTLPLPAGHFHIVADAPYFPERDLGEVAVDDGTTVQLPLVVLSPWVDFPAEAGVTTSPFLQMTADGDHALYVLNFGGTPQYRMFDFPTNAVHIFFTGTVGSISAQVLSPHGHYLATLTGTNWFIFDTQTANFTLLQVPAGPANNAAAFTSDEKYFVVGDGTKVHRFEIATATDTPITGKASTDLLDDGFLVQDVLTAPYVLSYFTATAAPTQVATGVSKHTSFVSGQTVIWNNCNGNCGILLLDQSNGMVKTTSAALSAVNNSAITAVGSGAWIDFQGTGGGFMNVATQAFTIKPLNFGGYAFNPSGTSVLYEITGSPNVLHLEAAAPSGNGTTVGNSTSSFGVGTFGTTAWLDDKRAIAFGNMPLVRYDIVNGTATQDTDIIAGIWAVTPPDAVWQRSSDKKWAFADREFNDLIIDFGPSGGGPAGWCETYDQKTFFAGGANVVSPAIFNTVIRNNSSSSITNAAGFQVSEVGVCGGSTSAGAAKLPGVGEYLVSTGQTIDFTLGHKLNTFAKSRSSGITLGIGQTPASGAVVFPSFMVIP